ncbi:MAG: DUF368 domain-containing protein [Treponema sp.]|nr:DUF368 domain-containing protein [Treponema sp.]MBQ2530632.1 DUF368 domain-containing protein [Treponema sp.]
MSIIRTFLTGLAIGMANVIPGVSGGTLAVVFNIYDKFVNAITLNFKKLWRNRKFVFPLLIGMLGGVLVFSKLISIVYEKFPMQTNYFFTGLILGSIPMLFKYMVAKKDGEKFSAGKIIAIIICALAGFALLIYLGHLEGVLGTPDMSGDLPDQTLPLTIRIFAAGLIGAVAMIIPGISGSLLMLIMGVYTIVMKSISLLFPTLFASDFQLFFKAFFLLLPNGVGVLIGLLSGAKLIAWLLKKIPNQTYAVIFGLICASAVNVFPGFNFATPWTGVGSIICLLAGAAMAYFSTKLAPEENTETEKKEKMEPEQEKSETVTSE